MNALIEHLRAMYVANGTNYVQAAADKLEAQAERIKELELLVKVKNKPICDYQELIAERDALRAQLAAPADRAALANAERKKQYAWECNECGSQEYTMSVSESDVHDLGCGKCGSSEWHKAEVKP